MDIDINESADVGDEPNEGEVHFWLWHYVLDMDPVVPEHTKGRPLNEKIILSWKHSTKNYVMHGNL